MSFSVSDQLGGDYFELAPDAHLLVSADRMILRANAQAESMFGYARAELAGRSMLELVPRRLRDRLPSLELWRGVQGESSLQGREIVARRRDGSEFLAEISVRSIDTPQGVAFATALRDVTARHSAEEQFHRMLESVADALLIIHYDGRIGYLNARAANLFGYQRHELMNQAFERLLPERFGEQFAELRAEWFENPHAAVLGVGASFLAVRKDGKEFPAELSLAPLKTESGVVAAASIRDNTIHLEVRDQLLTHLSELAHESRLSTMGEMVAGLAHELNQPLYAISNYAQACENLLATQPTLQAEVRDLTSKLAGQAMRASEIVRRLRRFVSRREPRRTRIDINQLVREVEQLMLFHAHRFSISTRLELADELPPVVGDSLLIEQVLVNLVRNAFEAMSETGTSDPVVMLKTGQVSDELLEVTVTDTGPGFGQITLEELFSAFFTTKEQGMGLGLVISRSIIEAHGGTLSAMPNPHGGAVFRLTLPVEQ